MRYIPKIIHMIWFGRNPYSKIVKKCMKSWSQFCPDYEIKIWNEDNFDIESNQFVSEAYGAGKWAFVSDYVRLYALIQDGGVYIDSDIELLRNIDELMEDQHVVTGYSSSEWIPTGLMASEPNNPWVKGLISYYDDRHFILPNGKYDMRANNLIITEMSEKLFGFKNGDMKIEYGDVSLYPTIYFHPRAKRVVNWEVDDIDNVISYYLIDKEKTYCVHYGTGTWIKNRNSLSYKVKHLIRMILPSVLVIKLEKIYYKHRDWSKVDK